MCPSCRDEATSTRKCIRCGKVLAKEGDTFINPNFDASKFEELSHGGIEYNEDIDVGLMKQL